MLYNSGRLKYAHGRNPNSGDAAAGGPSYNKEIEDHVRKWGMSLADWKSFSSTKSTDQKAHEISKYTGITLKPFRGDGGEIREDEKIPYEFGGKTYMVDSKTGLKVVNKDMLADVVSQAIEREEYVNDIVDLLLYSGDMGVAAIDHELYQDLNAKRVKPSEIRNTTDTAGFGEKILLMKRVINDHVDRIVFPDNVLEMLKNKRKHYGHDNVDMKRLVTASV